MLLTLRRLGPKSDIVKTARIVHGAQRTFARFAWFPILHGSGTGYPGTVIYQE